WMPEAGLGPGPSGPPEHLVGPARRGGTSLEPPGFPPERIAVAMPAAVGAPGAVASAPAPTGSAPAQPADPALASGPARYRTAAARAEGLAGVIRSAVATGPGPRRSWAASTTACRAGSVEHLA